MCCLVLAACRINFGANDPDAALDGARDAIACLTTHDEDQDAIDDSCDPCPHIAGTAADADGDGVGDACDPEPTVARQRIAWFDPFSTTRAEWSLSNLTVEQDTLHAMSMAPATSYGILTQATGEVRIVAAGTINATYTGTPHGIAISFGFNNGGANYHYVQFFDIGGAMGEIDIAKAEGGSFPSLATTAYAGTLPVGRWRMEIDESISLQHITLASELAGTPRTTLDADTATPTILTTGGGIGLLIRNADVTVDYLVVIETL